MKFQLYINAEQTDFLMDTGTFIETTDTYPQEGPKYNSLVSMDHSPQRAESSCYEYFLQ